MKTERRYSANCAGNIFDGFIDNKTVIIWGGSYESGSGRTAGSAIHPLLALLWSYNIRTLVYSDKAQDELAMLLSAAMIIAIGLIILISS